MLAPETTSARVDYPPGAFALTLSADLVVVNSKVDATVTGAEEGVAMRLTVDETDIATEPFSCTGPAAECSATATFTAPAVAGDYGVRVTELTGQQRTATAQLTVVAGAGGTTTTVPGGSLPKTGSDIWRIIAAASAVIGVGGVAVISTRRRRVSARAG